MNARITSQVDLRASLRSHGNHYLDPGTMRFFKSSIEGVYSSEHGCFFITCETVWGEDSCSYGITQYDSTTGKTNRIKNGPRFEGRYSVLPEAVTEADRLAREQDS